MSERHTIERDLCILTGAERTTLAAGGAGAFYPF